MKRKEKKIRYLLQQKKRCELQDCGRGKSEINQMPSVNISKRMMNKS